MQDTVNGKTINRIAYIAVMAASIMLDVLHSSWILAPFAGFCMAMDFWCIRIGYEEKITFIKATLIGLTTMFGLSWTVLNLMLIAATEAIGRSERLMRMVKRWN